MTLNPTAAPPGLTTAEAERRLASDGPNDLAAIRSDAGVTRQVLVALANPLILLLLAAGLVSAVLGQVVNAVLISSMVLLSVTLNFVQTFRSRRAVESLRREVAPTATVMRDGAWVRIPRRDLVAWGSGSARGRRPRSGRRRAAAARDLHVQQAALTGESLPVEKTAGPARRRQCRPTGRTRCSSARPS